MMEEVVKTFGRKLREEEKFGCMQVGLFRCMKWHQCGGKQKFTTSLHRFVRWECLNAIRTADKHRRMTVSLSRMEDFSRPVGDHELIEDLYECVGMLGDDHRLLVEQYYYYGYTLREIATRNAFSLDTARQRLKKAITALRNLWAGY